MSRYSNTLIVIGKSRASIEKVLPAEGWINVSCKDHHAKLVINFTTDGEEPPVERAKRYIRTFPDLRFVYYYEDHVRREHGTVKGRRGQVTSESHKEMRYGSSAGDTDRRGARARP